MAKRNDAAPATAKGAGEAELVVRPNILPGVSDDENFITEAGKAVVVFLRGIAGFFTTAQALEQEALAKRDAARQWTEPASAEDDVFIQEQIRDANRLRKEINAHWQITSAVSAFHKRLTSRRDKGADAAEETASIGNKLHNEYGRRERERVARVLEQERRQNELDAQAKRERELMELEQAAVATEERMPNLSQREERFVELVAYGLNSPTTSARTAGYKEPELQGERLMKTPKIQQAIKALQEAAALRRQREARAAAPLDVAAPAAMKPDIQKAAGAHDRTTVTLEIVDERAFVEAAFSGKYGIPSTLFVPKQAACNDAARQMGDLCNRWPGVRVKRDTKVV